MIFQREIPDADLEDFLGMLAEEFGGYPETIRIKDPETGAVSDIPNPENFIDWVGRIQDEVWKRKIKEFRKRRLLMEAEAAMEIPEPQINRVP